MEKKSKKKVQPTPAVAIVERGEIRVAIVQKRTPTGYRYHEYEPLRCWKTPGDKTMTSRTYTAHDTVDFVRAIEAASIRCQELDAGLVKKTAAVEVT